MEEKVNNTVEDGLSLNQILFLIKKNLLLIFIIVFVLGFAGAIYGFFIKDVTYSTKATGLVEAEPVNNSSEATAYSYSINLTNTFKVFVVSDPVIDIAYNNLKGKYPTLTKGAIKSAVKFETSSASMIVTLTASTNDPKLSIDIANSMMHAAQECANSIDEETGDPSFKILSNKLKIVQEASEVSASRGTLKIVLIAVAAGLILSFAIIFIQYLANDTYTSKSEFENTYGIEVLASIPERYSSGGKNDTKQKA